MQRLTVRDLATALVHVAQHGHNCGCSSCVKVWELAGNYRLADKEIGIIPHQCWEISCPVIEGWNNRDMPEIMKEGVKA